MAPKNINDIVEAETEFYLTNQSLVFLESAVSCLLNTKNVHETATILREFADQLEELG